LSFRPPRAEPLSITGPAGPIEALLEEPQAQARTGFGVVCHPHPLYGGNMTNKVVHTLARSLQEQGMPTVRFNYRGVGQSAGQYDEGRGETADALAVVAWGREHWPGVPLTLAGFSFGSMVALFAAPAAQPAELITVAPAVSNVRYSAVEQPACPWLIIQGMADEVVDYTQVEAFAARFAPPPTLCLLPGVDHFFNGRLPELREVVLQR
jgi:alpha/beta superfamily hydrolase